MCVYVRVIPGQKLTTLPSWPPLRCLVTWLPNPDSALALALALIQAAYELWLRWPAYFGYAPRFCCHTAATLQALRWQRGGSMEWSGGGGEGRQLVRIAMLLLGKLDFHIYLHARFRNDSCENVRFVAAHESVKRATILPELLLCITILISQLVKYHFSMWIFTIFTSQIYSHKFDNVLQIRIAWIVLQLVAIKSQIWSMLSMWPAQARRRNWSHVPGKCITDTHTHTHARIP